MRLRLLALLSMMGIAAPLNLAEAQRPQSQRAVASDAWELLGEQTVGFRVDSDSIVINQGEEWYRNRAFRALRFAAERNDVNLISIGIVYINGHREDITVNKLIRRGGQLVLDLPGERSFLKQIDMKYRGNVALSFGNDGFRLQQAVVKVFGERVQRRPEVVVDRPVVEREGWSEIDTQRFDRTSSQLVFSSRRGDGRFGQVRLKATGGDAVRVRDIVIRFRNGETQTVPIEARMEEGEETRAIDLSGETRLLDTVTVNLEPRRRPGSTELQLIGLRRPGGTAVPAPAGDIYAARGWTLLGEQTVGFTGERDVITVGQNEDWFRDRRFRSLHLIAQRNDIFMRSLRIVYLNGVTEDLTLNRLVSAGTDTEVPLKGERSYIRQIEMVYRARPGFRGQAVMKVYGEPQRR